MSIGKSLIILALQCYFLAAPAQVKRAFIVALDQYAPSTKWNVIHASNDTLLLKPALIRQEFLPGNITIVSGKDITKKKLIQAIKTFTSLCKPKDIVYFHYSGHGQQVADSSGDEADFYDESIVPVDASSSYTPGVYTGQSHLLDDELNVLLRALSERIGEGDLLVTIDACYSATGTRVAAFTRGTTVLMASPEFIASHHGEESTPLPISDNSSGPLPYTVISSANAYEVSQEKIFTDGRIYGPLAICLHRAFNEMKTGETYASLYQRIIENMALLGLSQTPCLEGNPNKLVFNRQIIPEVNYFVPVRFQRSRQIYFMESGELQGLFRDTEVAIYDINATAFDQQHMIATGIVQDASADESSIVVKELKQGSLDGRKKIVITKPAYGDLTVAVQIQIQDAGSTERVKELLQENKSIRVADGPLAQLKLESGTPRLQALGKPPGYMQLSNMANLVLDSCMMDGPDGMATVSRLTEQILNYMYGDYLRAVKVANPAIKLGMELLTGDCQKDKDGRVSLRQFAPGVGIISPEHFKLQQGNCLKVRFSNNGAIPVFFSVLVIDPQNQITRLLPLPNGKYGDYGIGRANGQPMTATYPMEGLAWQLGLTKGNYVCKLIATKKPLDLSTVLDKGKRNIAQTDLGLLNALFKNAGLGARYIPAAASDDIMVSNFIIEIQ